MEAKLRNGYLVRPAMNGGWVVYNEMDYSSQPSIIIGAFSCWRDLIAFLTSVHVSINSPTKMEPF